MSNLSKDLDKITGLKGTLIRAQGHPDIDTFSTIEASEISSILVFIEQYFSVAKSIGRSFDEIIFSLENGDNLIAYLFDETALFILRTEEKVNFPFVHMTAKLIAKKYLNGEYNRRPLKITPSISYKNTPIPEHLNEQPKPVPLVKEVLSVEAAASIASTDMPKRGGLLSRIKETLITDKPVTNSHNSEKDPVPGH